MNRGLWLRGLGGLALTLLSLWVVWTAASREPYARFQTADALQQLGLAGALLAWWAVWMVDLGAGVWRGRLPRLGWVGVALALLVLSQLVRAPLGYIQDMKEVCGR